ARSQAAAAPTAPVPPLAEGCIRAMFQTSLKPLMIVLLVLSVYTLGGLDAIRAGAEYIPSAGEEGKAQGKERPDLSGTQFRPQIRPDLSGAQFQPDVKRGADNPADAKTGPS